jgi:predicted pyridoxine 5'-phosphate oxidase superfamily flavin-nucleotide-binding protein
MELHQSLKDAIDAGVHGHLATINPDGSPQVTVIWLGRDGDELLVAHLGSGQKMRNLVRDPRCTPRRWSPRAARRNCCSSSHRGSWAKA